MSKKHDLLGQVAALLVLLVGAGATAALAVGLARPARAAEAPLVVIAAASSPLNDISRGSLRRAFLAEPTVIAGLKLLPLNQNPGTPERARFDGVILDLTPEAMSRFWIDQRIRGQGSPPRAIPSVPLLCKLVAQLPGAISYVRATDVPAGVKVLSIDGKKPGTPGYVFP